MSLLFQDYSLALSAMLALMPAVVKWVSGRRLASHLDDPSLPDRLLAHSRRYGVAIGIAGTLIAFNGTRSLPWAIPLMFSSLLLAGYPLRRVLFDETWSITRYLSFFHRLVLAVFGFWIVLAAAPYLASRAGRFDWVAGAALAALLIGWGRYYAAIFRWLLQAAPLENGPILERCSALATAAGMPQPAYLRVDLQGGSVANALALPCLRGNAVIFTDTLLRRLDLDEVAAICAHELAHFEHFTPARLKHMGLVNLALIAVAALIAPVSRVTGFAGSSVVPVIWFATLVAALTLRGRGKQHQETVCDQRAAGLIGDGEPLVSALTKLHALARMPRRLAASVERASSHPSLARRIRDIRKAAGTAPSPLDAPVTFASRDGRSSVTFDRAALHWVQQAGVTEVLGYPHLLELRLLAATAARGPRLRAVTAGARHWEMPVTAADVTRLQQVLDQVDGQLGDAPAPRGLPISMGRLLVAFVSALALTLGQVVVAIVAVLAWLVPAAPLLAAAGVAALAAAALGLRDRSDPGVLGVAVIMAVAGAVMLLLAREARQDQTRNPRMAMAALGGLAGLSLLALGLNGLDPISLHVTARSAPATIVLWLSAGSALACAAGRRVKVAGLAALVIALGVAAIASQPFLDTFGRDPLLVSSPALSWTEVDPSGAKDFEIPAETSRVHLSPTGLAIAARQYNESGEDASTYLVGEVGQSLTEIEGTGVQFVDDSTLLVLGSDEQGSVLRQVRIDAPHQEIWRQRIPGLFGVSLSLSRADRRWRLSGYDRDDGIARAEGIVGGHDVRERKWPARFTRDALIDAVTTDGREPLVVESSYDLGILGRLPGRSRMLGMLLNPATQHSRFWSIGEDGVRTLGASRLGADCSEGLDDGALACSVFDGSRTRLVRLSPDGQVTGLGWIDDRFASHRDVVDGWLTGWVGSTAVAIDLANRRMLRVPRSEGMATELDVAGGRLAAVVFNAGAHRLRIYALQPEDEGALARRR